MTVGDIGSGPISALHPSPRCARGEAAAAATAAAVQEPQTGSTIKRLPLFRPPGLAAPPAASHAPIRGAALRLVSVTA